LILAANGEIYNHRENCNNLKASTNSKPKVIARSDFSFEQRKGPHFIDEMNGILDLLFTM
jgi:asparagine synthase (glutamine-hydrolysing)